MSSAALAYYYTGGATMTASPAISAFTTAAPNLYDGAIGDTATNNSVVQGTTGGGNYNFYAMIDLGPTPPAVTKFTAQRYGNAAGGMTLFYATSTSSGYTQVGTGLTDPGPFTSTFAAITARYWLLTYRGGGNYPATIGMTDFRLYDAASSVILPPGTVVSAQPRNLTTVVIY